MNTLGRSLAGTLLVLACSAAAVAQTNPPPPVLQITREFTKPGKNGTVHEKAESAFVQAMTKAKWPTHYVGMTSLSGKMRCLFLTRYESYEAWEKDTAAIAKNEALSAALDRAQEADGALLDEVDQGVFVFHEEMSLRTMSDISKQRYLDISAYHVKPGHRKEWEEAVKLVKAAYEKGVPSAHWGMYEQMYGGDGGTFVVLTARKTLAELDQNPMNGKAYAEAMGEEGIRKLNDLVEKSIESSQHQLFAFNPKMSYVEGSWIKSDDFWKVKPAATPAAKPAAEAKKP